MYNVAIFLGYMIGSFLTGFFFKEIGSTMTFKIYSGLAALCALIYIIIYISYLKHTTVGKESSNLIYEKGNRFFRIVKI